MKRSLLVDTHYDRAANAIFRAHTLGHEDAYVGWDVIVDGDEHESVFVYMVPNLDSNPPEVDVYVGKTGDPTKDVLVAVVTAVAEWPPDE